VAVADRACEWPEPDQSRAIVTAMKSKSDELFDQATEVSAKDGEVILDGPDGVDVKLTPEAARETSTRLWDGAAKAKAQRDGGKPGKGRRR
jgi:hypothetical protein